MLKVEAGNERPPEAAGPVPAGRAPLVVAQGVTKTFPRVTALNGVGFSIEPGERVALVGPSGSGKTTLLNLLSGTVQPDAGALYVAGRPLAGGLPRRELAALVGIIHQQFDLVPQLPVLHNVLAGRFGRWGTFRSLLSAVWPQDYPLAAAALERMGIADKVQERTSHLSGGEQQRVAIARAIVQSPRLVLADEPVASLDPARAEEIMQLLVDLTGNSNHESTGDSARDSTGNSTYDPNPALNLGQSHDSGRALVASIHTTDLVRRYFTRVIGLRDGELQFDMPATELTQADLTDLYDLSHEESSHHWH